MLMLSKTTLYIVVRNIRMNINVVDELWAAGNYETQDTVGLRSGNLMLELSQKIFMIRKLKNLL